MESQINIWIDGDFVDKDAKSISVLNHSFQYGSAVYEKIRFYTNENGKVIFKLKEHVERFFKSASYLPFDFKYTKEQLQEIILTCVQKSAILEGEIRLMFYFGSQKLSLLPQESDSHLAILVLPVGTQLLEKPVLVKTSPFVQIPPKSLPVDVRISGNSSQALIAEHHAKKEGYDEALFLDYEGNITGGVESNFFIVKNGILFTPPLGTIYPEVLRESLIKMAHHMGVAIIEKYITLDEAYKADEAFFAGTLNEIRPIAALDENLLKEEYGPLTKEIQSLFREIVNGKIEKFNDWMTRVNLL